MNGYFRLVHDGSKTSIRLFPPTGDGEALKMSDLMEYLMQKDILYDKVALSQAVLKAETEQVDQILENRVRRKERECYKFTITPDNMKAYARFYASSEGGEEMTAEELKKDLEVKGIKYGILDDVIASYFANREYCKDILIAEGTPPVQGTDARIEYYFNTDKKAKPTLKEDGSVDFFQLNVLQHCNKGDLLARLIPEKRGELGMNLMGEYLKPKDVQRAVLKFGKNIELSEDHTTLTACVNGHVELVEGRVFVSDVLEVENVDNSTGNIDYDGSVQVNGNVFTNFQVKAKGNIEVKGVVEGAYLEAGGNIIITRGMNGMGRGTLKAGGNIISKFLENTQADAEGYVASESILHSTVRSGAEVTVSGKRGFITGGRVSAVNSIEVKTLGSSMGADTTVEVGIDPHLNQKQIELQQQIDEDKKTIESISQILSNMKEKVALGIKLSPEQLKYIQSLAAKNQEKTEAINKNTEALVQLQEHMGCKEGAFIVVTGTVYPGVKISIGNASQTVQGSAQYCRFIKSQGDVKLTGI